MSTSQLLERMRSRPNWGAAVEELHALHVLRPGADDNVAERYSSVYQSRRASMVFDVVASRQRDYMVRVLQMVESFEVRPSARSLTVLAESGPGEGLGLMASETTTVQQVAKGLVRYCAERHLDDDAGVLRWATEQESIRFAPKLDPYVGSVKGIGIALFAYLRMRSGANAVKPDVRVRRRMNRLGFNVPDGDVALVLTVEAAAEELELTPFAVDQLLW